MITQKIKNRFFAKIHAPNRMGCCEWAGKLNSAGYGRFQANKIQYRAHRFSWIISNGDIPDGLLVCHKCDNPRCVNVDHLFLGTDLDNNLDKIKKGRANMPKGEMSHKARLTENKIKDIRNSNISSRKLALCYGVSHHAILCIKRRETWKHVE